MISEDLVIGMSDQVILEVVSISDSLKIQKNCKVDARIEYCWKDSVFGFGTQGLLFEIGTVRIYIAVLEFDAELLF